MHINTIHALHLSVGTSIFSPLLLLLAIARLIFLRPKINRCRLNESIGLNESLIVLVSMRTSERANQKQSRENIHKPDRQLTARRSDDIRTRTYDVFGHLLGNKLNTGQRRHDETRGEV